MEDRVEDAPISTGRTVAAAIAAVAVVAGCLTSYRINPVVPLVIGPMPPIDQEIEEQKIEAKPQPSAPPAWAPGEGMPRRGSG